MDRLIKIIAAICIIWEMSFGQQAFINNVPDYCQPPAQTLPSTIDTTNFCAPFAFLNIVGYWDLVQFHPNAIGLMAGLLPWEAAEYIGWFMDTNNNGSPFRLNGNIFPPATGTYIADQWKGAGEYVRFDASHLFGFPDPVPPQKIGYDWIITPDSSGDFMQYVARIDSGFPVKVDFLYWHIHPTGNFKIDTTLTADTIHVYAWDTVTDTSGWDPEAPSERWNLEQGIAGIGHAVTGVGYIIDTLEFAIVHDNWDSTPKNIAIPWINPIPWQNVPAMLFMKPPSAVGIDENSHTINKFRFHQNYPNPFNATTTIEFSIPYTEYVTLEIYNVLGEEVATLVSERLTAGNYKYKWDASSLPSGIYFYRIQAGDFVQVKKMILIR